MGTKHPIRVLEAPIPELGDDIYLCYGSMTTLSVDSVPANTTLFWNTGDTSRSILVVADGIYTVDASVYNEVDNTLCHGHDTIRVTTVERPVIDFEAEPMSGCVPLMIQIDNNSTPGDAEHLWYILNQDGTMAYSSLLREPIFQIADPGIYSLYYRITTPYGCTDSLILWSSIEANEQPVAEFLANPEISLISESGGLVTFQNYADPSPMSPSPTNRR